MLHVFLKTRSLVQCLQKLELVELQDGEVVCRSGLSTKGRGWYVLEGEVEIHDEAQGTTRLVGEWSPLGLEALLGRPYKCVLFKNVSLTDLSSGHPENYQD